MDLTPTDLTKIGALLIFVLVLGSRDDPRAWNWVKAQWSSTAGAWFAKRRMRIRVGAPDEHSTGIMVSRRDINTGSWT